MNKLLVAAVLLLLTACDKPIEVPKAPPAVAAAVAVAPAPAPAIVIAPAFSPNPEFFKVKPAEPAPTPVAAKQHKTKTAPSAAWYAAERAAYEKAYRNAKRANDLLGRKAYDTGEHYVDIW